MITAPGAPLTGLALLVSTIPSPSPNHHTPSAQAIEARERQPYRRPPRDPDRQQQLDRGEDRVQQHGVMLDEGGVPGDRAGDDARVAGRRPAEHLAEPLGEHEGLVLQHAVEQPYPGQRQLQQPPDVRRSPGRLGPAQPAPRRGTDSRGGDLAHPVLLACPARAPMPGLLPSPETGIKGPACRSAPLMATQECQGKILWAVFPWFKSKREERLTLSLSPESRR